MKIAEYQKVKDLTYLEYCNYLQKKYGIGKDDYMTKSWNKKPTCTRTSEGLLCHHLFENKAIQLSNKEWAMKRPFEWQLAKNLVYCDYLEHLYLHILICEYPENDDPQEMVGIGGVINYIVPELNDFYSGWETPQPWRKNCHNLIVGDKDVYLALLKRFKAKNQNNPLYEKGCLCRSYNEAFGSWSNDKNKALYREIEKL